MSRATVRRLCLRRRWRNVKDGRETRSSVLNCCGALSRAMSAVPGAEGSSRPTLLSLRSGAIRSCPKVSPQAVTAKQEVDKCPGVGAQGPIATDLQGGGAQRL